jgi:cytokinin dehydrogenase
LDRLYRALEQKLQGVVLTPDQLTSEHQTNFGHVHYWMPRFVVRPRSHQDIVETVRFVREHGLFVSTRGAAHSQSQLGISQAGILLDMKSMDKVLTLDEAAETVDVEAGVVWRDLVHHLKKHSLVPRVLTNNLGVTVGGTVSMAGIGVASFKYGSQGDNVLEMDVVTGAGETVTCGPDGPEEELFWSVVAGLGQVAIATRLRLQLRRFKLMTRTYYLLYDDIRRFLSDSEKIMDDRRWDHIESWSSPCSQGIKPVDGRRQPFAKWFFPYHLTVEYDRDSPPDDAAMLAGLKPYDNLYTDDIPTIDFFERLLPVFELWKKAGTWDFIHPWMECVLPWDTAADYIDQFLVDLSPGILIGGHILLWPAKGPTSRSRLFMRPKGENLVGFGILPAIPPKYWDQVRPMLDSASRLCVAMGAKRYLSGYVDFTQRDWVEHYGDRWEWFAGCKHKWDPDGLLNPGFVPLPAAPGAARKG